jgi:hypothetical protein
MKSTLRNVLSRGFGRCLTSTGVAQKRNEISSRVRRLNTLRCDASTAVASHEEHSGETPHIPDDIAAEQRMGKECQKPNMMIADHRRRGAFHATV